MSLESAFRRLSIRPSTVCHQCRRSLATSASKQQQQRHSATASFADIITSNRDQSNATPRRASTVTATAPISPRTSNPAGAPIPSNSWERAAAAVREASTKDRLAANRTAMADLRRNYNRKDLEQQVPRRWKPGDVYSPHDLSGAEAAKWKRYARKPRPKFDVLDQLGINPLDHYKNVSMMSEYMTEMGKIKHGNETGLRPVNQRKMAKAIRRAVGLGLLMPGTHKHPELLKMDADQRRQQY